MLFRSILAVFLTTSVCFAEQGTPTLAKDGLKKRIAVLDANDPDQQMELAFLSALRAVEKAAQFQVKQGLGRSMIGLPFLGFTPSSRFERSTKEPNPDALRTLTGTLLEDLDHARDLLNAIKTPETAAFVLNVEDLWFDLDGDGQRSENENAVSAMTPILGRQAIRAAKERKEQSGAPLIVRFDEADIYWLTAYTHALSTLAEMVLAFDPTPTIEDLRAERAALQNAPAIPLRADITQAIDRIESLKAEQKTISARNKATKDLLETLANEHETLQKRLQQLHEGALKDELLAENATLEQDIAALEDAISQLEEQFEANAQELKALSARLPKPRPVGDKPYLDNYGQFVDAIYLLIESLRQSPNRANLDAARVHWAEMVRFNQEFWQHAFLETDNDREWVPNPNQRSAIGVTISEDMIQTWQDILLDANALVKGELLIPHPLLPRGMGISLAAYFEDPAPLDILGWIHGRSSYPYARRGDVISPANWRRLQTLSRGNAMMFAIFLN